VHRSFLTSFTRFTARFRLESGEWRVHQSIENITTSSLDPEAIQIAATPQSIHDYLRFEKWALGFQEELDRSWAVLGEIYGRFEQEGLDKLKLRIRRLRSTIEDKKILQQQVRYVPELIRFTVAEPELLRLLMGPLYSDNPLYGLRELTQNAADSVKELQHLVANGTALPIDQIDATADIEVMLPRDDSHVFTIKDRGTGMTLEVVKDFFLRAGASFRNSELWKQQFADEAGKSRISRSGRFGVGALSAFLIGDVLRVYTRHFSDKTGFGFRFTARIEDDEIEILQERGPIGTIIEIESDEGRVLALKRYLAHKNYQPFFYILENPRLEFSADLSEVPKYKSDEDPRTAEMHASMLALPARWISVSSSRYESIKWDRQLRKPGRYWPHEGGFLYCNGILVGDIENPDDDLIISNKQDVGNVWDVFPPTVSIVDYSANLPLDLARKGLSRSDSELTNSVMKSMWEELISSFFYSDAASPEELVRFWNSGDFLFGSSWIPILFRKDGFSLLDDSLLHEASPSRMVIMRDDEHLLHRIVGDRFFDANTIVIVRRHEGSDSRSSIANLFQEHSYYRFEVPNFEKGHRHSSETDIFNETYIVLDRKRFERVFELANYPRYLTEVRDNAREIGVGGQHYLILSRFSSLENAIVKEIADLVRRTYKKTTASEQRLTVVAGYSRKPTQKSLLWETWQESIIGSCIPYAKSERSRVLKSNAPIKTYLQSTQRA
jgi:hypothetical protein